MGIDKQKIIGKILSGGKMVKISILCFIILISCSDDSSNITEIVTPDCNTVESPLDYSISEKPDQQNDLQPEFQIVPDTQIESELIENIDMRKIITNYAEIRDIQFWNDSMQTAIYIHFLENNNLASALEFRAFLEAIDQEILQTYKEYTDYTPRPRLINPVIVLINNSGWGGQPFTDTAMDFFAAIYAERPDLFFQGDRGSWDHSGDVYSRLPIIHAVEKEHRQFIQFFVENVVDWQEMRSLNFWSFEEMVWWDIGEGGNLLSYLPSSFWDRSRIHNFLVENGIEEYSDSAFPIYVGPQEGTNVWKEPGFNSEIIRRITKEEKIKTIRTTTYRVDDRRWVYFEMEDGTRGWAPYGTNIRYESGA